MPRFTTVSKSLELHGWSLSRVTGSHHIFKKKSERGAVVSPVGCIAVPVHDHKVSPEMFHVICSHLRKDKNAETSVVEAASTVLQATASTSCDKQPDQHPGKTSRHELESARTAVAWVAENVELATDESDAYLEWLDRQERLKDEKRKDELAILSSQYAEAATLLADGQAAEAQTLIESRLLRGRYKKQIGKEPESGCSPEKRKLLEAIDFTYMAALLQCALEHCQFGSSKQQDLLREVWKLIGFMKSKWWRNTNGAEEFHEEALAYVMQVYDAITIEKAFISKDAQDTHVATASRHLMNGKTPDAETRNPELVKKTKRATSGILFLFELLDSAQVLRNNADKVICGCVRSLGKLCETAELCNRLLDILHYKQDPELVETHLKRIRPVYQQKKQLIITEYIRQGCCLEDASGSTERPRPEKLRTAVENFGSHAISVYRFGYDMQLLQMVVNFDRTYVKSFGCNRQELLANHQSWACSKKIKNVKERDFHAVLAVLVEALEFCISPCVETMKSIPSETDPHTAGASGFLKFSETAEYAFNEMHQGTAAAFFFLARLRAPFFTADGQRSAAFQLCRVAHYIEGGYKISGDGEADEVHGSFGFSYWQYQALPMTIEQLNGTQPLLASRPTPASVDATSPVSKEIRANCISLFQANAKIAVYTRDRTGMLLVDRLVEVDGDRDALNFSKLLRARPTPEWLAQAEEQWSSSCRTCATTFQHAAQMLGIILIGVRSAQNANPAVTKTEDAVRVKYLRELFQWLKTTVKLDELLGLVEDLQSHTATLSSFHQSRPACEWASRQQCKMYTLLQRAIPCINELPAVEERLQKFIAIAPAESGKKKLTPLSGTWMADLKAISEAVAEVKATIDGNPAAGA
ncbi:unnamed protein product [Amoebophrya sp. A120]|nr:unnamed protein product [Amoebophrya sp. A120]|eukprot:GSA120T00003038001.1